MLHLQKKDLKIAVNTSLLLSGKMDGIGRFADETLRIITQKHPEHQFYFYFDRPFDESFIYNSNIKPFVVGPPTRHPLLYLAWFEMSLPLQFLKSKPDVFFSPDGFLSLSSKVKSVGVIHDLNFEHFPTDMPFSVRQYYTKMFPKFAHKAERIATVSEYSKKDISELYQIAPDKIDVVYNGAGAQFKPTSSAEKDAARKKFSNDCPYFFFWRCDPQNGIFRQRITQFT